MSKEKVMTTEKAAAGTEGTRIRFSDRMTVRAIKGARHLQVGKEYSLHPIAAGKLIDKGYAEAVK